MREGTEERKQSEDTKPTGVSGGNASASRRSPRPVVVGETFGLDRTHVDAAHLGWGSRPGLTLHPEKTRGVKASEPGGFDCLGYPFERGMKWPREKSLKKMKDRVREKTPRLDGRSWKEILADVNRSLRGWDGYFQHSQANVFATMDGVVRRRLRSVLEKRRGRTRQGLGSAHQRWPNEWFARSGLLSLKAEHEGTRTIVRLRTHCRESRMRETRQSASEGRGKVQSLVPTPILTPGWTPERRLKGSIDEVGIAPHFHQFSARLAPRRRNLEAKNSAPG